jgi:hypothetical protein
LAHALELHPILRLRLPLLKGRVASRTPGLAPLTSARMVGGMGARGTWFFVVVGAVIGLVLGILVSVSTDVRLAPEAGLVLGALVGWFLRRVTT